MRKPRVKWFLFVLALLAVVIGIPVIINESYKANSGYMTMWGAADALAYYGTILGSLVAVATVVVTILFTYCSGARSLANRARSVSNITPA